MISREYLSTRYWSLNYLKLYIQLCFSDKEASALPRMKEIYKFISDVMHEKKQRDIKGLADLKLFIRVVH